MDFIFEFKMWARGNHRVCGFSTAAFLLVSLLSGFPVFGQTPTISVQPQSQTNGYGSDAVFNVTAGGADPIYYQWQKNGVNLSDYENVAGSQTASLNLVGISGSDVASYSVIVRGDSGSVTSSIATLSINPVTVFVDNFESGLGNWHPLKGDSSLVAGQTQNHTPGGAQAAWLTNDNQRIFHNFGTTMPGRCRLTFWMFDGSQPLAWGELRGYTGPGYGKYANPGGLKQELAVGKYTSPLPTNGTGALSGQTTDTNKYQARVWRGQNSGWFNLNLPGSPNRSPGWHKFQIDRLDDGSTVDFYVDDILSGEITGAAFIPINSVVLGSDGGAGQLTGNAWFDDVAVENYPDSFDWQSMASPPPFFNWMQLRETGTNSQVVGEVQIATVFEAGATATNACTGAWMADNGGLSAVGLRGSLDYSITAPTNDAYRIEIEGAEKNYQMPCVELPLVVSIDGEYLGRFNLPYGPNSYGLVHCFTPYIQSGTHTLRVLWDNANGYRKLHLQAVRLQSIGSEDVNSTGLKAWVANRLAAQCGVDVAPTNSAVSPVCVEGRGQYLTMMSLTAGTNYPLSSIPVQHGPGYRWYANVPLSPAQPTIMETSFQNGGLKQTNQMVWQATDLLGSNNIVIRKGDSLLLTALPEGVTNGTVSIAVSDGTTLTADALTPIPYQFNQPGLFSVAGGVNGTFTGILMVKVVDASLGGSISARVNRGRYWNITNLSPGVVIEPDPRLHIVRIADEDIPESASLGTNGRQYRLWTHSTEPRYVVARLGWNGPVLDSAAIDGFRWFTAPDSYLRRIQSNSDGSELVESTFIMSPVCPTVTAGVEIIVGGVTFEDGTVTKTLSASDFDALGSYKIHFIRASGVRTSVCHVTKLYDSGYLIGWK